VTALVTPLLWGAAVVLASLDVLGTVRTWNLAPALLDRHPFTWPRKLGRIAAPMRALFKRDDPAAWEDVSYSLAFHMRAGETPVQALRAVSMEKSTPPYVTLRRAVQQYDAGSSFNAALAAQSRDCPEIGYLAGIFEMGMLSGGNMPSLLCHAAEAMRRRRSLRNEVRSRMVEARTTAALLSMLPWLIGFLTLGREPRARAVMLADPRGRGLLLFAVLAWLAGNGAVMFLLRSLAPGVPKQTVPGRGLRP
jgi:tight adherence protein B